MRSIASLGLTLAATVAFTVACAPVEDADTASPGTGQSESRKAKKTPKTIKIGDKAKDGKFTFTVTGFSERTSRIGNEFAGADPQGKFILVKVTVFNHSDKPQTFFGDNQKLRSGDKEYTADTEAAVYMEDSQSLWEEINPGNRVKGTVVFDVPKNVTPEAIELHDSMFSGGVKVALTK